MRLSKTPVLALALGTATALMIPATITLAGDDDERSIVTVAFGAGLNTAQPGNPDNHHILPETIKVSVGDVVNFVVAGLHVIRVYDNGVGLRDLKLQIPDECEVNPLPPAEFPPQCLFGGFIPVIPEFDLAVYYRGIDPLAPPPPPPPAGPPPFVLPSIAVNRVESVAFLEPGRYLVICAILPHFNDAMYAWIEVRGNGNRGGKGGHNGKDDHNGKGDHNNGKGDKDSHRNYR